MINNIDKEIHYEHVKRKIPKVEFHLHGGCEIYFLISGDVKYFVEKTIYPVQFGDLIVTNHHEVHKPVFLSEAIYERITIEFNPSLPSLFTTSSFDLLHCFYNRKNGEKNKLSLSQKETSEVSELFHKYEQLNKSVFEGVELLKLSCFVEILVYINRLFASNKHVEDNITIHWRLFPILDYIESNLSGNLSLRTLEKTFHINRFYLSKLFKSYTGITIHEYIINKRISAAKKYLSEGYNVTESCLKSGFSDYSNFLKMFKRIVGMLPKEYMNLLQRS